MDELKSYRRVGRQLDKRCHYKGTLEVGQGVGRKTREMELIWSPDLFPNTKHRELSIRFYVKKYSCELNFTGNLVSF